MSHDPETFGMDEDVERDPLVNKQKQDVESMRRTLLSCNTSDPNSVKTAMNNILVMRVYHQISRIIKYTEQMDKIEEKLYNSIDTSLETMNEADPRTWVMLLNIQERLQKIMIDSHKLLEPYMSMENLQYIEIPAESSNDSFAKTLLDQSSREKLRSSAQALLNAIDASESKSLPSAGSNSDGGDSD